MSERHTIVCLSSQRWDDAMWTNKQHIMSRLAAKHRVIYVDCGAYQSWGVVRRALTTNPKRALSPLSLLTTPSVRIEHGVEVLRFPSVELPLKHGRRARQLFSFDARVLALKRYLAEQGVEDAIVWVYHPGYGALPASLPHSLLVYDCVDEYTAFPEFSGSKAWISKREEALCRAADVVFCTASTLYDSKRHLNPETHLVHNVGDGEHFSSARDAALQVPTDGRFPAPVIGFVGAVSNYKLNVSWLLEAAIARRGWQFVVIGPVGLADPTTDVGQLTQQPNVHLLGHRAYAELPAYIKGFDVAVIPYRTNDYTRGVFPIKFFELLASGKPVVISRLPALQEFYDAVEVADDAQSFIAACERALAEPERTLPRRLALAEHHSWPERVRQLMAHIERVHAAKAALPYPSGGGPKH